MKITRILWLAAGLVVLLPLSGTVQADEYECTVYKKHDPDRTYTPKLIAMGKYTVYIKEIGDKATLSLCSYVASQSKVICDSHEVDKVVFDFETKIKKYYAFKSQVDVQVFHNQTFVENNGRGVVGYGKCRAVSP